MAEEGLQEPKNILAGSNPDVLDQTGSEDKPLAREDILRLLSAAEDTSKLILSSKNLSKIDLRDLDLQGADLSNTDLSYAILRSTNLEGANLQRANLQGANLREADLREAGLQGASLQRARLQRANLQGADLQDANLPGIKLIRGDLYGANLRGANLESADLLGANLLESDLQGAKLQGADLRDVGLSDANLSEADLQGANLSSVDLRFADLQKADLSYAKLQRTDLRDTDLRRAKLYSTDLLDANLQGATLFRHDISKNFLSLTDQQLAGLNLQDAELGKDDSKSNSPTEAPFKEKNTILSPPDHTDQLETDIVHYDDSLGVRTENPKEQSASEQLTNQTHYPGERKEKSAVANTTITKTVGVDTEQDTSQKENNIVEQGQPLDSNNSEQSDNSQLNHYPEQLQEDREPAGILPRPSLMQNSDPITQSIREEIWSSPVQSVERTPDDRDTQTLDIHITPSNSSLEAEKEGENYLVRIASMRLSSNSWNGKMANSIIGFMKGHYCYRSIY